MTGKRGLFDVQGLTIGVILCALGILFLKSAGLVTGQAAGLALLLSYVLPWEFGVLFFAVGAPFLVLAWGRRGPVFTLRTLIVVIGISLSVEALGRVVLIADPGRPLAALLGGVLIGIGVLAVFRHNASAGGLSILSLVIEQKTGIKAGWVQLGVDGLIFLAACFVLEPTQVAYSFVAAALMNLIIIWNFDIRQARSGGPLVDDPAQSNGETLKS
ncbi:YitT family protein [Epibacterium sp. SM1979]|uniref:YitT family protein n=1 Tax=Tritonibacter litoralis TaxID=2662264 RepID=A0A843YH18_9RHOB|nr:YitT family protein [Tritonibacter litoralis]MQQ08429.1 YitT family protein [Tritonibacter litoralis]